MTENELEARPAIFRATIEITRAATGKVDVIEIIGTPIVETPPVEETPCQ